MGNQEELRLVQRLEAIKAIDIMSRFAITITEEATISDLAHLLMRFKISGVPVVHRDGTIIGIVTATDLFTMMKKIIAEAANKIDPQDYLNVKVQEIMTKQVSCVNEKTNLFDIMKIICDANIHTLPVISSDGIVGIIGRRDV